MMNEVANESECSKEDENRNVTTKVKNTNEASSAGNLNGTSSGDNIEGLTSAAKLNSNSSDDNVNGATSASNVNGTTSASNVNETPSASNVSRSTSAGNVNGATSVSNANGTSTEPQVGAELSQAEDDSLQSRLFIIDRSGTGEVTIMDMDSEHGLAGVDPATDARHDRWSQIQGVRDFGAVVVANQIYIIGGYNTESRICSMRMRKCTPLEEVWEELPNMTIGRTQAAVCSHDNKFIFIIGGQKQDGKTTKSCEIFDTSERKWSKGGVMPAARKNHACAADGTHVFVSGGHSGKKAHRNLWIYEQFNWQEMDEDYPTGISQNLERHCMVFFEHTLYFLGGITYERRTVPLHNPQTDTPARSTAKIIPHVQNKVESFKFHVRSGDSQDLEEDELLDHFISPWDWRLPAMSCPRHSAGCFVHGRKIYMVGGTAPDGKPVRDVECFNLDDQTWTTVFRLPKGNYQNVICIIVKFPKPKVSRLSNYKGEAGQDKENSDKYSKMKWILW